MYKVNKANSILGAFIEEIDLSQHLNKKQIEFLYETLAKYEVIFFRNQILSHKDHSRLASAFGEMQTHPAYPTVFNFPEITILENDKDNPSKIEEWHTDCLLYTSPSPRD